MRYMLWINYTQKLFIIYATVTLLILCFPSKEDLKHFTRAKENHLQMHDKSIINQKQNYDTSIF